MNVDKFVNTECTKFKVFGDCVEFTCDFGEFIIYHEQDCCETVSCQGVIGVIPELPFTITKITETDVLSEDDDGVSEEQEYFFFTNKGDFSVQFSGSSNGYYGTAVSITPIYRDRRNYYN